MALNFFQSLLDADLFHKFFLFLSLPEGILFKKVKLPDIRAEFNKLSKEIQKQFQKKS